jgi:hypothetical protein
VSLVKPIVKSGSRVLKQNLFCKFWTLLQVSTDFGSLKQFLELKTIENDFKTLHSVGPQIGPWPAARGRSRSVCGGTTAYCAAQQPPGPAGLGTARSARTARGHRAMATRAASGWRGQWHPTGR